MWENTVTVVKLEPWMLERLLTVIMETRVETGLPLPPGFLPVLLVVTGGPMPLAVPVSSPKPPRSMNGSPSGVSEENKE